MGGPEGVASKAFSLGLCSGAPARERMVKVYPELARMRCEPDSTMQGNEWQAKP